MLPSLFSPAVAGADLLRLSSGDVEGLRGSKWEWGNLRFTGGMPEGGAETEEWGMEGRKRRGEN